MPRKRELFLKRQRLIKLYGDDPRECRRCHIEKPTGEFPRFSKWTIFTCRACHPQYKRGGKPERERKRQWTLHNQEKRKVHKIVEYAVKRGELVRECCQRCGAIKNIQSHHDDYSRPFHIMWLCPKCHAARHIELGYHRRPRTQMGVA